jgi:hypothetical protein
MAVCLFTILSRACTWRGQSNTCERQINHGIGLPLEQRGWSGVGTLKVALWGLLRFGSRLGCQTQVARPCTRQWQVS